MDYLFKKLRQKALSILSVPENYQLAVEDNIADEKHRLFIWEDPQHLDANIEITLDSDIRYVWKKKDHAHQPDANINDRSFDSYLHKKLPNQWLFGNSIKVAVEKSTGRLLQLHKDNTCVETLSLSRDECLENLPRLTVTT